MDYISHTGVRAEAAERTDGQVIWRSESPREIVSRIAVAGDFLPGGALRLPLGGDWNQAAERLAVHFADVDTSFVNLEATLDTDGLVPRALGGLGDIVAAPAEALAYLRAIRSQAVGMANNHTYDFGSRGVSRTRAAIKHYQMVGIGGESLRTEQPDVFVWQGPRELRVGFWAAARASTDMPRGKEPGVEPATFSRGQKAFERLKQNGARFSVALLHAGSMRTNRPEPEDLHLMNSLAHVGFDLIAASHSHRITGYQRVDGESGRPRFCFYGLGSLVSGYSASPLEREGLIVVAALGGEGALVSVEVRPVFIDATGFGAVPAAAERRMILERFEKLTAEIEDGSYANEFYREVSRGLGRLYARDIRAAFRAAGLRGLAKKAGRIRMRHVKRFFHKVAI